WVAHGSPSGAGAGQERNSHAETQGRRERREGEEGKKERWYGWSGPSRARLRGGSGRRVIQFPLCASAALRENSSRELEREPVAHLGHGRTAFPEERGHARDGAAGEPARDDEL